MLNGVFDLLVSFMPMWDYVLTYIMAIGFIATVPCIIREVVRINV